MKLIKFLLKAFLCFVMLFILAVGIAATTFKYMGITCSEEIKDTIVCEVLLRG